MEPENNTSPKKENTDDVRYLEEARKKVEKLKDDIDTNNRGYSNMADTDKLVFTEKLTEFFKDMLLVQIDKMESQKKINEYVDQFYSKERGWIGNLDPEKFDEIKKKSYEEGVGFLDKELVNNEKKGAQPKKYVTGLTALAIGGIGVFAILLIMAGVCATGYCGVQTVTTQQPNGGEATSTASINVPLEILESQFMLAMIGGVIAPIVMRVLKEKYDIQIEASQIGMVMTDALQAVKLYQKEADKLRDKDGQIIPEYQAKLRDLAFDSMKTNYTTPKYKSLVSSIGVQVFDKAIEHAVKNNWIERYPFEKEQVREIINQSIDALPQIVEWNKLDNEVKMAFLDGHVRKLLANVNVNGWRYDQLSEIFDSEISKRVLAAAVAEGKGLLKDVDKTGANKYTKYTSTVARVVEATWGKN